MNTSVDDDIISRTLEQIKRHKVTKQPGKVVWAACPHADTRPDATPCEVVGKGKPERIARLFSGPAGSVDGVWCQQLKCKTHGMFRVLPTILVERKHYVAPVIDEALEARVTGESVESFCSRRALSDPSTPYRWIRAFIGHLQEVARRCLQWLLVLLSDQDSRALGRSESWTPTEVWTRLARAQELLRCRNLTVPGRAHFALTSGSFPPLAVGLFD